MKSDIKKEIEQVVKHIIRKAGGFCSADYIFRETDNLYSRRLVYDTIALSVEDRSIVTLIGPNNKRFLALGDIVEKVS